MTLRIAAVAPSSRAAMLLVARRSRPSPASLVPIMALRSLSSTNALRRSAAAAMEPVFTPKGVTPIGPYSQAIKANGFVFVSGQIPAETDGKLIDGTTAEKTHKMCQNAKAVLEAAGSGLDKVVKITVYFQNMDDFKVMNEVYATYFPHKPARSSCEANRLPASASMEMDIIALY
ncbi:hypothetical protein JDV02_009531 [Purpureocillium takamizusanense]|uniref:Uncharacterized protein n=1 Tax=Purpureocillium takamizusanense TaxID=2060973 RepID=A0A9Q8QS43_9HYPO|nr:uncharacterized protein JDV02_009531 [Purpureocillium takamizusanense]UNI23729.1 hypothetical protein JDV02_009531 [Purpureocillium takamizusanense]